MNATPLELQAIVDPTHPEHLADDLGCPNRRSKPHRHLVDKG
ncbi:hypothetical protein [Rhodoferax sp.]|nr:hypothetical protein [Rhodoferax sp.]MDZ4207571.1 hypothetical protein [Rhodoferax sp.]